MAGEKDQGECKSGLPAALPVSKRWGLATDLRNPSCSSTYLTPISLATPASSRVTAATGARGSTLDIPLSLAWSTTTTTPCKAPECDRQW